MIWEAHLTIYLLVAARLLLPLLIPRYPLLGILACLLLDAADQSLMQAVGINPPWYQGYDKALDVYYLSIAYLATMRNWENVAAFQVGRVLFYLRLIGVLAFELTGVRLLLAIFPNAFEPFFIYYELVRRKGNPMRLTRNVMVMVVAIIWLVVKLPQEWWIHIAKLDATDFIKTRILGATLDTSFWRAIIRAPAVTGTITAVAAIVGLSVQRFAKARSQLVAGTGNAMKEQAGWWEHWRRPSGAGRPADVAGSSLKSRQMVRTALLRSHTASSMRPAVLIEKIVLVALVSVIFQQTLPELKAGEFQTALFVGLTIATTDFLLRWVVRHFGVPISTWVDLGVTAGLNYSVVLLFQLVISIVQPRHHLESALIFASLVALFITLYDHCRPLYDVREVEARTAVNHLNLPEPGHS